MGTRKEASLSWLHGKNRGGANRDGGDTTGTTRVGVVSALKFLQKGRSSLSDSYYLSSDRSCFYNLNWALYAGPGKNLFFLRNIV